MNILSNTKWSSIIRTKNWPLDLSTQWVVLTRTSNLLEYIDKNMAPLGSTEKKKKLVSWSYTNIQFFFEWMNIEEYKEIRKK